MLAVENCLGLSVLKSNEGVLPITHMIAEADVEHYVSEIVTVEKEPKSVNNTVILVNHNKSCWGTTSPRGNTVSCPDLFSIMSLCCRIAIVYFFRLVAASLGSCTINFTTVTINGYFVV